MHPILGQVRQFGKKLSTSRDVISSLQLTLSPASLTLPPTFGQHVRPLTQLAAVGKFETKQSDENLYSAGQPFLHRVFGYRGVTLIPWLARVHDIDIRKQYPGCDSAGNFGFKSQDQNHHQTPELSQPSSTSVSDGVQRGSFINVKQTTEHEHFISENMPNTRISSQSIRFHPYYQVLIDTRDCAHVSNRLQTDAVTFLGRPENSKSVNAIKGVDCVAHEDILPYTSLEEKPIKHELQKELFKYDANETNPSNGTKYNPTYLLDTWKEKHPWLELSRVYRETTENVRVTVIPFYLGHTVIRDVSFYWWRYSVRLENFSDISVHLRERHWKIFSQTSMLQTIKGRGVVGVEPLLSKLEPAYQYSSHVTLQDKSGHMWGTFRMEREDGYTFECRIPPFSLISSQETTPPSSKNFS